MWQLAGIRTIGEGDVDSGFCRKDWRGWRHPWQLAGIRTSGKATWVPAFAGKTGGGGGIRGNSRAFGHRGRRRGFRLSPERLEGVAASVATRGHSDIGEGDVGSGFRRKDWRGWRHPWQLAGIRTSGKATWVPAFAGKTGGGGGIRGNSRAFGHRGRRRGFRLSPERRELGSQGLLLLDCYTGGSEDADAKRLSSGDVLSMVNMRRLGVWGRDRRNSGMTHGQVLFSGLMGLQGRAIRGGLATCRRKTAP